MDLNKLMARVKAILLTPKTEWPVVATEPTTAADLYKGYIVWLAALPALIGLLFALSFAFVGSVVAVVVQYVVTLAMVYVMALIVEALAPTFGGQKDRTQALKVVAYSATAAWIASIGTLIPVLGLLIGLAGLVYTIYLLYLGLPYTMKCSQDKAAGYTAVTIIIGIVLSFIMFSIVGGIAGVGAFTRGGSIFGAAHDDAAFDEDSPLGKLEQWSKNVEEASEKLEAAERSGDQDAQAAALQEMMGAALGGGQVVESLPTDRLKPFVPESLAGMPRSDISVERNNALGLQITEARASYVNEAGRTLNLEITDAGTARGLLAFADWSGMESESETDSGYEKTYRQSGRLVHEQWDRDGKYGEYAVVLGDRFTVEVNGQADSLDELKAALAEVDLRELESLKGEGVKAN